MGGLKPKSLSDKSVVAYAKAKAQGKGFDSLSKTGRTFKRNTKEEEEEKIKKIKQARLGKSTSKTLLA